MSTTAVDRETGIAIRFVKQFELAAPSYGFSAVTFACGRTYSGESSAVRAAARRHEQAGCKRCRRAERRIRAIAAKAASRFAIGGSRAASCESTRMTSVSEDFM